jgi:hypothetical protein
VEGKGHVAGGGWTMRQGKDHLDEKVEKDR